MCGISGFLWRGELRDDPLSILKAMGESLAHRGPDAGDAWVDAGAGVGLAHRRLAILDLSPAGHQPMISPSGRYVIVYNGEIYNHQEIRTELTEAGIALVWRGHSDTETLLAAIDQWGLESAVARGVGMFAFALWDRRERVLSLVRDRLGEKPLYFGWVGAPGARSFVFGSELKALRAHPDFHQAVDRNALALLLRHNYIPAPYSIYEGIQKLAPASILSLAADEQDHRVTSYWSATDAVTGGQANSFVGTSDEAVDGLEEILSAAVKSQMLSDVPLGAFLSGGVDSSLITALMQSQSSLPVKTFTIGFADAAFNEAEYAKEVSEHLGTDHTELHVSPRAARDVIPRLPTMYDEPFADSSQIPTFLVAELARKSVTVALSGDGGDELFGGYNRYALTSQLWTRMHRIPTGIRRVASRAMLAPSPSVWDAVAGPARFMLPASLRHANLGDKIHKAGNVIQSESVSELYQRLVSLWQDPEDVVLGSRAPPTLVSHEPKGLDGVSGVERMMALDMLTYLPDDILAKVDRAAMSVSLETRVPLLDHRVVEFAWRLPLDLKLRQGETKWALRQILYRHVPRRLIERPKIGFGVPLATWLRGELRDWAEALLDEGRLRREGYFNPAPIREKWAQHLSGSRNWSYALWGVLMFQAWLEAN